MSSPADLCYQIPAGVQASQVGQHIYLSTTQGGKVLVDARLRDLWERANNLPLNAIIEKIAGRDYSETELRAGLACLCEAGLLARSPSAQASPGAPASPSLQPSSTLSHSQSPLVTVVIVSYNSQSWLKECLASLAGQSYQPLEIILVDNHSRDNTAAWLAANHPNIHLIQHTETVSLAQAINSGVEAARGTYFLLLNPDIRLEPDALDCLVQKALAEPDAAAVAAKLKLLWTPEFLNGIGNQVGKFGFGVDIGLGHLDLGQFDSLHELPSTCFAAALLARAAWEKAGPLDPDFPLYYEDSEWCYRARLLGYSIVAAPQAIVYHAFGSRTPENPDPGISAARLSRVVYGRLRFANKLLGDRYRRRFNRGYLLEDCLRLFLAFVRLRASQVSAILTGRRQFWQTADLPAARESLQKRRQVADESLFALQKTFPSPLIWGGAPVLTWDIIQSVYLPLIQAQETRPLPEFPASYRITIPPSSSLQRWNRIRQLEGTVMLFQHIYRAVQRRLAIP